MMNLSYFKPVKQTHIIFLTFSVLSGLLYHYSYTSGYIIFIALIPWIHILRHANTRHAIAYSLLIGFFWMASFHYWILGLIHYSSPAGVVFLWLCYSLYQGLYYGLYIGLIVYKQHRYFITITILCVSWPIFELIRPLLPYGSPGGSLGLSVAYSPELIYLARWIKLEGISGLVVLINGLLYIAIIKRKLTVFIIILLLKVIIMKTDNVEPTLTKRFEQQLVLIDTDYSQSYKLNPLNWQSILNDMKESIRKFRQSSPTIIIFPETIVPGLVENSYFFKILKDELINYKETSILFGLPIERQGKLYNSIVRYDWSGFDNTEYRKQQLIPIGEYLPFRNVMNYFRNSDKIQNPDYSEGDNNYIKFESKTINFITAICLEVAYNKRIKKQLNNQRDMILILANTAWFEDHGADDKIRRFGLYRAVENQLPIAIITNKGHTFIANKYGKIIQQTDKKNNVVKVNI